MAQSREERLAKQREWRAKNKARIAAYNREYAQSNPEVMRAKNRRYKERHRDELARKQREYMAQFTPEERARIKREEYDRNWTTYRAYTKRHYAQNADEQKRKAREWVEKNPERRRAYLDEYLPRARALYYQNHERELARARQRRAEKPEVFRAYKHKRRGAEPEPEALAVLLHDPCSYCGASAVTIDHIVPIVRGGGGEWENLTAACKSCNSKKHTASLLHFMLREATLAVHPKPEEGHTPDRQDRPAALHGAEL